MDKYELRRLSLIELMHAHCFGKATILTKRLERSDSYVARMLYEEGKAGKKRIGEDMAALIERTFGLGSGALERVDNNELLSKIEPPLDPDIEAIVSMLIATDAEGRILAKNAVIDSLTQYRKRKEEMEILTKKPNGDS